MTIEKRKHGVPYYPTNIFEIDVDAPGTGISQSDGKIRIMTVDDMIGFEDGPEPITLRRAACDRRHMGTGVASELHNRRTDGTSRCRDDNGLTCCRRRENHHTKPG